MRIVIGASKGGAGKTTTALHLATGLALRGEPTLLLDGDKQRSATAWWNLAEGRGEQWPVTLSLAEWPAEGPPRLPGPDEVAHVVVDTGPGDGVRRFYEAVALADVVVVASKSSDMDIAQVSEPIEWVVKAGQDRPLAYAVLLTQVRLGRNLNRAQAGLAADGVPCWDTVIPHREDMVPTFGHVPDLHARHAYAYGDLLTEITATQED